MHIDLHAGDKRVLHKLFQNINHQSVLVARNLPVNESVQEYVVVSCCTIGLTQNMQVATLITADLSKNKTLNWDLASGLLLSSLISDYL